MATELERGFKIGAQGLKVSKTLGLRARDKTGKLVRVDDPRLDPIWAKCGELGIPINIHTADLIQVPLVDKKGIIGRTVYLMDSNRLCIRNAI